jgi:hypothetical protein
MTRPLTVPEINKFRNLIRDGKIEDVEADGGWYTPEELYETIELYREAFLRLSQGRSVKVCPMCGDETWVTKKVLVANHPEVADYFCRCRSCDWSFKLRDVPDAEKAAAI